MERQGRRDECPPFWINRPTLLPDVAWVLDAFDVLSRSRQYTMTGVPLPIVFSDLVAYLDVLGARDAWKRRMFVECIIALDDIFMADRQSRQVSSKQPKGD